MARIRTAQYYQGFLLVLFCLGPSTTFAEESGLTLTITPPLFQINLQPGEHWASGIEVVNGNPYDLTVYAQPVLFESSGESGRPRFKDPPTIDGTNAAPDQTTLAGWITVPTGPLVIKREQTITIPIAITVPIDAAPGGHYAAILIGNRAPQGSREESALSVTSSIASLIMLRVAGTVIEQGRIRDFATEHAVYQTPQAQLSLRFENQGNVHLQPKGNITIYNMFGKKRGVIPINQGGDYGNVMPGSIRKFTYSWQADAGVWDIGRYRAEATLGYGGESQRFAQATVYFYILPFVPIAEIVGSILMFVLLVGWALRAYVRRAISMETKHQEVVGFRADTQPLTTSPHEGRAEKPQLKLTTLMRPIQVGIVDLRSIASVSHSVSPARADEVAQDLDRARHIGLGSFLYKYRYFFAFVCVTSVAWVVARALFAEVLTYERPYQVKAVQDDGTTVPVP
jgi:hypothetical protein